MIVAAVVCGPISLLASGRWRRWRLPVLVCLSPPRASVCLLGGVVSFFGLRAVSSVVEVFPFDTPLAPLARVGGSW